LLRADDVTGSVSIQVVKYWPEKGKSGFVVWRYLFRRDDPEPAPWTAAGKRQSKKLGITMQVKQSVRIVTSSVVVVRPFLDV